MTTPVAAVSVRIPDFLIASTCLGFIAFFAFVGARAIRDRGRANRDAVLFFGVLAMVSVAGLIEGPLRVGAVGSIQDIRRIIGLTLPLLLLRLLDGFTPVPVGVTRAARAGYLVSAAMVLLLGSGRMPLLSIPATYSLLTLGYATVGFVRYARDTSGVTRRRMQALGLGTLMIALIAPVIEGVVALAALGTGLAYYLGIVPPAPVRRIWQYAALTEVLRLLARTPASLPLSESVPLLNRGTAAAVDAPSAAILVWDERQQALISPGQHLSDHPDYHPASALATRAFDL